MDLCYLDIKNLNFGIDECYKFEHFEDDENPTPTNIPSSNLPNLILQVKKPMVNSRISVAWNHFTIIIIYCWLLGVSKKPAARGPARPNGLKPDPTPARAHFWMGRAMGPNLGPTRPGWLARHFKKIYI